MFPNTHGLRPALDVRSIRTFLCGFENFYISMSVDILSTGKLPELLQASQCFYSFSLLAVSD